MDLQKVIEDFEKKSFALVWAIKYRGIEPENIKIGDVSIQKNYEMNWYITNTQSIISYTLNRTISTDTKDF
jgi:uncharacterized protein YggE